MYDLEPQMNFDFYLYSVPPKKRYAKWFKPKQHESASVISQFYNISMSRAYKYLDFFSKEEIEDMRSMIKEET